MTYTDKSENCTVVESSTEAVTWNAGWYVVNSTVTISESITVNGDVNLVLPDGYSLTFAEGGKFNGNYVFYQNGSPVELETVKAEGVTGPATVQECGHEGILQPNGNGCQHGGACPYCCADIPLANHTVPDGEGNGLRLKRLPSPPR